MIETEQQVFASQRIHSTFRLNLVVEWTLFSTFTMLVKWHRLLLSARQARRRFHIYKDHRFPLDVVCLLLIRRISLLWSRPTPASCWLHSIRRLHPCKSRNPHFDDSFLSSRWRDLRRPLVYFVSQNFSWVSEVARIGTPSRSYAFEQKFRLLILSSALI